MSSHASVASFVSFHSLELPQPAAAKDCKGSYDHKCIRKDAFYGAATSGADPAVSILSLTFPGFLWIIPSGLRTTAWDDLGFHGLLAAVVNLTQRIKSICMCIVAHYGSS
jgi:hypothetical protein